MKIKTNNGHIKNFDTIHALAFLKNGGNDIDSVAEIYTRIVQTGVIGTRQFMSLGINVNCIHKNTGMTLEEVKDKFKNLDIGGREALLNQIIGSDKVKEANESLKNINKIKEIKKIISETLNSFTPKQAFFIGIFFGAWLIALFLIIAT